MRTPLIVANWKMNKTVQEALAYATVLRELVSEVTEVEIVIAPPFTALHAVAATFVNTPVGIAGQDLHWEAEGTFTGEVSAAMLREAGAEYVIIGHSERRQLFGETDEWVNVKIRAAISARLTPIVCVGETLAEQESDQTFSVLDRQLDQGLANLSVQEVAALVVAYEPVWAIGTGRNATAAQAQDAHAHIRQRLATHAGDIATRTARVIYGGSVKPGNVSELSAQTDVDGALVGGASLEAASFAQIVAKSLTPTV